MSKDFSKKALAALKVILVAGSAVIILAPYRVEKTESGETTYHAPLYKLSYHTTDPLCNTKKKKKTVHTVTFSSFGLLSDQLITMKRLYKATVIRSPYIKERIRTRFIDTTDTISDIAIDITDKVKDKAISIGTKLL